MFEPLTLKNAGITSPYTIAPLFDGEVMTREAKAASEAMDRAIRDALDAAATLPSPPPGWEWVLRMEADDDVDLESLRATNIIRMVWRLEENV